MNGIGEDVMKSWKNFRFCETKLKLIELEKKDFEMKKKERESLHSETTFYCKYMKQLITPMMNFSLSVLFSE